MLEQVSNAVTFYAFYTASQTGKTGLTVTVDVWRGSDGNATVTAASATEIGDGVYKYQLASGSTATESEYIAVFKTTDTTVDFKWIPAMWAVGKAGVEDLDATVSSRSTYAGGDTSGTTTLLARLTSTRAGLLDHLDADVSTRLATSGYTTPPTAAAVMAAVLDELASNHNTAGSVGKLIQNLDAAVSSRLASAGYTAPPSLASIVAGIWDEVQSGHTTTGSFGKYLDAAVSSRSTYAGGDTAGTTTLLSRLTSGRATNLDHLDADVSSRSTYAGADTAGTTTLLARLTSGRASNLDNLDAAVSGVAASVWAAGTRTLTSFGTLAADVWNVLTASLSNANTIGKRIADNLDAAVSSRLSAGGYTAPDNTGIAAVKAKTDNLPAAPAAVGDVPTAAANADAVWDEQLSGHTTTGSAGAALGSVGASADPLQNQVPGSYAPGSAGAALGLLDSTPITVTVTSPVADTGDVTVVRGDDYFTADGRSLSWTLDGTLPSYGGATPRLVVGGLSVAGTVGNPTGVPRTVTVELTAAQTASLTTGTHRYELQVTLASGHVTSPVGGYLYAEDKP